VILYGYVQMNVKNYDDCPIRRSRLRENGTRRIYCDTVTDWSFSYHYSKLVATDGRCGLSSTIKIDIPWQFPNSSTRLGVCSFDAGKKALIYLDNWTGINAVSAEITAKKRGATSTDRVELERGWTVFFAPSNPAAYGAGKGVSISGRLLVDITDDGAGLESRTVKTFRL
jgi:hypothetical protein